MKNAEWMIKNGMSFENLHIRRSDNHYYEIGYYVNDYDRICNESKSAILNHGYTNDKDVDVVLRWLQSEHVEPILDDEEQRYLESVIRPFRNDVTKISKRGFWPYVFLKFNLKFNGEKYFFLNNCYTVTMFKGMEPNRWYTLEELGL